MAKLGEVCSLKAGKFVSAENIFSEYKQGLYPCFGGNGSRGYVSDYTHDGEFPLIGRQGALCGNVNIASGKFHATEHAIVVQPKVDMNIHWLYYALIGMNLGQYATGAAQPGLAVSKLEMLQIVIPSRLEQDKIARTLAQIEKLIFLRKQQLAKLDELVKARFVETTSSSKTRPFRMGDVATYINGYAFKPTDWSEKGRPIIRIQNLNDKKAKYNYYQGTIDEKYHVINGDVLVSWATHLEAYIWDGADAWLNQHIFKVVFDKVPVNKVFFVYSTEDALRQAFKNAHGFKPTMEHIKRSDFENAVVKLPTLDVQNDFASFVERVDQQKQTVQQSLDKLELMKKALMQEYFG